jgi:hypothetical protein
MRLVVSEQAANGVAQLSAIPLCLWQTNDTLLGGLQLFMIWRILLTTRVTTLFEVFGYHLLHYEPEFLITCSLSFWKYKKK